MGDFSLPSINWLDGCGQIISNPNYGVGLNNLFIDLINDIGFIQFVNTPNKKFDLVFTTSTSITDLSTAPGMSNHEAIVFYYNTSIGTCPTCRIDHLSKIISS